MSQETIRAAERAAGQVNTMSTYDPDSTSCMRNVAFSAYGRPDRDVARLTYFACVRCSTVARNRRESPWVTAARLVMVRRIWACSTVCSPMPTFVDALRPAGCGPYSATAPPVPRAGALSAAPLYHQ